MAATTAQSEPDAAGRPESETQTEAEGADIAAPAVVTESRTIPAQALLRHEDDSDASLNIPDDTAARPRRPRQPRKKLWRAITGVLLVIALMQAAWLQRDRLVSRWGVLYAPVQRVCQWAGCTVAPPRQIEALAIESSNLSRNPGASGDTAAGGQVLTLTVFLRNKATYPVAFPALELTLSDEQSQPVVRRVFRAADYVPPSDLANGLTPHAERAIRLRLMSTVAVAANYRVAALYP